VFFHISGMARNAPRPSAGDEVSYDVATAPDGKMRAVNVGPAGLAAVSHSLMSTRVVLSTFALLVFPVLWWFLKLGKLPTFVFWTIAGMSVVAFILYGLDKLAAKRGAQRTPEFTLQSWALLGGWPGALLAQQVFRHKSSKRQFQIVFWAAVVLNCGVLGFLVSPKGTALLRQALER